MKHLRPIHFFRVAAILIMVLLLSRVITQTANASVNQTGVGLYPDLQTVVPTHVQIVNQQGQSELRFSNGVANTGAGPLRLRPENVLDPAHHDDRTYAIQEILDANGNIVSQSIVSNYQYHPAHHHWHIDAVAQFEVHKGAVDGPIVGTTATKVTFCLIDWYKLNDNSPTKERVYWDCATSYQGISPGWVDQYHMSLEGQSLYITDVPTGKDYYFVSTANPLHTFLETDYTNNVAWLKFDLVNDMKGNAKMTITGHSPCASPGMCGDNVPNR